MDERPPSTELVERAPSKDESYRLRVMEGPDQGTVWDVAPRGGVLGAADDCEFTIHDGAVSRRHLEIKPTAEGLLLRDLRSTNGTFYLDNRVNEVVLKPGAIFVAGRSNIMVEVPDLTSFGATTETITSYGQLIGRSAGMQELYTLMQRVEKFDQPVLIRGETGVGKELVAQEIHEHSNRGGKPFEIFDCGAVAPNLVESELFGHEKGAFTGAERSHDGLFVRADGGTVFLDELGELPLDLQPKLLRVLENGSVRPVGGQKMRSVDVRVLAATHRDLEQLVEESRFRSDLYYRLNVVELKVLPLRERREDIPELVRHIVAGAGIDGLELSDATIQLFTTGYDWPGNIRELKNAVLRVAAVGQLPPSLRNPSSADGDMATVNPDEAFAEAKKRVVDSFERDYLTNQLKRADGNIAEAARLSDMDRAYFRRILIRHGLLPK